MVTVSIKLPLATVCDRFPATTKEEGMLELEEDCALEEETAEELDWIALEEEIAEELDGLTLDEEIAEELEGLTLDEDAAKELDFPELLEAGTTGLMAIPLQRTSSMYK